MRIQLKDIDAGNWREALKLEPNPGREHFFGEQVFTLLLKRTGGEGA